jgi:hypothetical protein
MLYGFNMRVMDLGVLGWRGWFGTLGVMHVPGWCCKAHGCDWPSTSPQPQLQLPQLRRLHLIVHSNNPFLLRALN